MPRPAPNPEFPAVILTDTREQRPYPFDAIPADVEHGGGLWRVRTEARALPSGDYSLDGFAHRIAVERKSVGDLFGTLSAGRGRFVRELERLAAFDFAAVVIEGDWHTITTDPPARSQLPPRAVFRSVLAWQQRYPRVHWWPCPSREFAEVTTFRILERFLKEEQARCSPPTSGGCHPAPTSTTSSATGNPSVVIGGAKRRPRRESPRKST